MTGPSPVEQAGEVGLTEAEIEEVCICQWVPPVVSDHSVACVGRRLDIEAILAARLAARDTADAAALARVEALRQSWHSRGFEEAAAEVEAATQGRLLSGSAQDRAAEDDLRACSVEHQAAGGVPVRCTESKGHPPVIPDGARSTLDHHDADAGLYWNEDTWTPHAGLLGDTVPEVEGDEREALDSVLEWLIDGEPDEAFVRITVGQVRALRLRRAPAVPAPVGTGVGLREGVSELVHAFGDLTVHLPNHKRVPDEPAGEAQAVERVAWACRRADQAEAHADALARVIRDARERRARGGRRADLDKDLIQIFQRAPHGALQAQEDRARLALNHPVRAVGGGEA